MTEVELGTMICWCFPPSSAALGCWRYAKALVVLSGSF